MHYMSKEHELRSRERSQRQVAREQLIRAMLEGCTFRDVSAGSPPPVKQAMAYRLLRAVRAKGDIALQDGRHGHPIKLRGEARAFLEACCREAPSLSGPTLQVALRERFDLQVSVSQINRVRAALGVSNPSRRSLQEKNKESRGIFITAGVARRSRQPVIVSGGFGYKPAFLPGNGSHPDSVHG